LLCQLRAKNALSVLASTKSTTRVPMLERYT
jgi:hypothetical protein